MYNIQESYQIFKQKVMALKLFPHILFRVGGSSFNKISEMKSPLLLKSIKELLEIKKNQEELRLDLCSELLNFIRLQSNTKVQNALQNARRDIYNNRNMTNDRNDFILSILSSSLQIKWNDYMNEKNNVRRIHNETNDLYIYQINKIRQKLQLQSQEEYLKKGLVLSSHELIKSLEKYSSTSVCEFRKKEYQTETSLLKYLTRISTKTTPFSTFNNLTIGVLDDASHNSYYCNDKQIDNVTNHFIRLNNSIFKHIKVILESHRPFYLNLGLRVNSTLKKSGNSYKYLINQGNVESFKIIQSNPIIGVIINIIFENQSEIQFEKLKSILYKSVDASKLLIENFIRDLLINGLLEYNYGISGTDPNWNNKLFSKMNIFKIKSKPIRNLMETLKNIQLLMKEYSTSDSIMRLSLLNSINESLKQSFVLLANDSFPKIQKNTEVDSAIIDLKTGDYHLNSVDEIDNEKTIFIKHNSQVIENEKNSYLYPFKAENMLYEDTTSNIGIHLNKIQVENIVSSMDELMSELRFFEINKTKKQSLVLFFEKKYSKSASINLLKFYEDYSIEEMTDTNTSSIISTNDVININNSKESKISGLKRKKSTIDKNQDINNSIDKTGRYSHEKFILWSEQLSKIIYPLFDLEMGCININLKIIKESLEKVKIPKKSHNQSNSFGMFMQFYQSMDTDGNAELKGVLNSFFSGYGKMMSRFLYLFPSHITDKLIEENTLLMDKNSLLIENCDATYFNANLHPPLLPYEVFIPGGHNSLPSRHQLAVTDFEVVLDKHINELVLIHKPTGKNAYVLDLGLEARYRRSKLYQLLENFTKAEYLIISPLLLIINNAYNKIVHGQTSIFIKEIIVKPRIEFESMIILQRKTWQVPKVIIPIKMSNENDFDYFIKLNEWRRNHNIDSEVYITIGNQDFNDPQIHKTKPRSDDYKPQYIDFENPILIKLFEKMVIKASVSIKIQEMAPHSCDLLSIDDNVFVTETLLQWYK